MYNISRAVCAVLIMSTAAIRDKPAAVEYVRLPFLQGQLPILF